MALRHPVKFSNGASIPALGFGTWQSAPGEVGQALQVALEAGFKHIDCARVYQNEPEIGQVFAKAFESKLVKREELFVTSKLWNTDHHPDHVEEACRQTLADLQVGYLDLYLMHWPASFRHPTKRDDVSDWFPKNEKGGTHQNPVPLQDTWVAMEKLVGLGLVKAIGVSNFSAAQLQDLYDKATIKPVAHQIELQPALPQEELCALGRKLNVVTQAYCPLGIGLLGGPTEPAKKLVTEPEIVEIAKKEGIDAAQLLLRWGLQMGNVVLTKSVTPSRITQAAATPLGGLSDATMHALKEYGLDNPYRCVCPMMFQEEEGSFFPPVPEPRKK